MQFYHWHALQHHEWPGKMTPQQIIMDYEIPLKALMHAAGEQAAAERMREERMNAAPVVPENSILRRPRRSGNQPDAAADQSV